MKALGGVHGYEERALVEKVGGTVGHVESEFVTAADDLAHHMVDGVAILLIVLEDRVADRLTVAAQVRRGACRSPLGEDPL